MNWIVCIFFAALTLVGNVGGQEPGHDGYHLVKKQVIGGDGSWDYLTIDPEARLLYIARETRVLVLDMNTFKVVHEIPNTNGVHGVALVPEFNRLFTSNGRDNKIGIYDLKTLEKVGEAKAGAKPDAIIYDAASHRVFAFNNGGTTATALDAKTGEVAGTVELGGAPEFAVADGKGRVYVNLEDKSEVVQMDSVKLTVLNRWPLDPGKTPTGLALDLEHRRLFSGCRDTKTVVVMDADSGKVLASLPIGAGVDAVAFDPASQTVFSSNGDGTLTVIHEDTPDKFQVTQTVATQAGARTLALDPSKHQVWLVTAETKPAPESPEKRRRIVVPDTFTVLVLDKN
ncbi:MAG TPA: YncE family protein [Planctomycetota bacterium]|jgi:DNA-binding beta-propeller fold protein YncE